MTAIRRVLMTGDTVGGVWTYCLELAAALAQRGIDVVLATMGGRPSADQLRAAARVPRLELHASELKLEWMDEPWDDVARSRDWLASLAARTAIDVLHANTFAHGDLELGVPRVVVGHSCVRSWWRAVLGQDAPASWRRYTATVRAGLAGADAVGAPTAAMLAELHRGYGPLPRTRVAANGRDPAAFAPGEKRRVVLAAGRFWDQAKNLACVDRAAARLAFPVRVAGDCARRAGDDQPRHVCVLGRLTQAELAREYAHAAVFVSPARYEPFGLAILEAALSGCALVLGNIASLRETWGDCACFVPPDDDAALARAVESLMADADERRRVADRARARALQFGPRQLADGALALYQDAIAARSAPQGAACAS